MSIHPTAQSAWNLTRLILAKVGELGEVSLDAFFPAKYPEARLWRGLLGIDRHRTFSRVTFSATLSRLQRRGLVERRGSKRKARWRVTAAGKEQLRERSAAGGERAPIPDGIRRIVMFDIPERERRKRTALRVELIAANYRQLQKSVWIGDRPLPHAVPELIDALGLATYVHIFSIRDTGTIAA